MIETLAPYLIVVLACIGAWVSRMCGGGWPKLPWGLDQFIYAIPHGVLGAVLAYVVLNEHPNASDALWLTICTYLVFTLIPYANTFAYKRAGHGQWFDMGTTLKKLLSTERLDFIVDLIMGPDSNTLREGPGSYRRDFVGMSISGLFIDIANVIFLLVAGHFMLAALIAVGGMFKGAAYGIGLWLKKLTGIDHNVFGEILTGFVDTFCVGVAIWVLLAN